MAQAAKEMFTSATMELDEATRQAIRYLGGHQPSTRIIHQKIQRVREKEEEFKRCHYTYHEKAKMEIDSKEATGYFQEKLDKAADVMDECAIFIEEREFRQQEEDKQSGEASFKEEEKRKADTRYQHCLIEISIDERIAKDLCKKVEDVCVQDDLTMANSVLMKTHVEGLAEVLDALTTSWRDLMSLQHDDEERKEFAGGIFTTKTGVKAAMADAIVFVEKCEAAAREIKETDGDKRRSPPVQSTPNHNQIKPEKMKLPTFVGNIRTFAKFKKDFAKIVVPFYPDEDQRAYVLKESCLKGKAKGFVENIDGINDIWRRLDDKYGDTIDLVHVVIKELEETQPLKSNDDQKFIDLVDKLEKGLTDLEAIGARAELANAYTVKMVESRLNRHVYMEWLKAEGDTEGTGRFEKLLNFLYEERRRVEKLVRRNDDFSKDPSIKDAKINPRQGGFYGAGLQQGEDQQVGGYQRPLKNNCLLHPDASHFTRKCYAFKGKSPNERAEIVKKMKACPLCLSITHLNRPCPWKEKWGACNLNNCTKQHSRLLHEADAQGVLSASADDVLNSGTLLLVQEVPTESGNIVSFFDSGSTISLVSRNYVERNNMKGIQCSYDLVTVDGECKPQATYFYEIPLKDSSGKEHTIQAFRMNDVCGRLHDVDVSSVVHCFDGLCKEEVRRPNGPIDLLIGMRNAWIHPRPLEESDGLVLYESIFGSKKVLGGCHLSLAANDQLSSFLGIVAAAKVKNVRVINQDDVDIDFFTSEEFGVKLPRSCEKCKSCKCTSESHQWSREEMREQEVILANLVLNPLEKKWSTTYPYKYDPRILEDNEHQADNFLCRTERRVLKSEVISQQYKAQFDDFIRRGVFREIPEEELQTYEGPVFYVTHHEVYKEGSSSTPMRIVINSSLKFRGCSLNDVLMKGPNTLNDIFGVQLRFRSYPVPLVCDLTKFYHSIQTTEKERHLRRVKWRDLDPSKKIKTYGIETVTFGDRPAAAIASTAVRRTAEIYKEINPKASERIIRDSYVDDIATGEEDKESAEVLKEGIKEILGKGSFKIKGFVTAGDVTDEELSLLGSGEMGKVLGIGWNPKRDIFMVKVRINLSKKYRSARTEKDLELDEIPSILEMKVTRRMLLSVVNSCYDPYGLLAPITVQLKILLRRIHNKELKLGWDDALSHEMKEQWVRALKKVKEAEAITFERCIKPRNPVGQPDLIICNDGSELAMCATAHVRWECEDDAVVCWLWAAKTRVTPLQKLTIPRIEMQSAVMGVRLAETIKKNTIWKFRKIYHVTDSKCLLATLTKDTVALGEFTGNRVAEILDTTEVDQWYHVRSNDNIADLGTREAATKDDINESSYWQKGPVWMYSPVDQWPVDQDVGRSVVPEEFMIRGKIVAYAVIQEPSIDYEKLKGRSFKFAENVTARLIRIKKNKSFRNNEITVEDINDAEKYMIKTAMKLTKEMLRGGKLRSLRPEETSDGTIQLGGRALEGMQRFYGNKQYPILSYDDPIAHLWMKSIHEEDHTGVTRTVAKSRRWFWIVKARKLATKIRKSCYRCRLLDKQLAQQQMAPLPAARQVMSPTFHEVSLDLFGPFQVKDTVKGRVKKKVWGLIINCLVTRAVHIDVSEDYSMMGVLQVIRKFIALRGSPAVIHSDKGSQLSAASELKTWAVERKIKWEIKPAEGQHQNGTSESLIKSIKRSLGHVIGEQVLTFSGIQMVFYEVATLINGRPIGVVTGSDPTQPEAITPNHLILGRATSDVIQSQTDDCQDVNKRLQLLQSLVGDWWKRWYQSVLPTLVPSYKWHQRHRNVKIGDICLIKYANELKGTYKLGKVQSVKTGDDGLVRTVTLIYKNPNEKKFREVDRPIHGIAVIVPIEEQSHDVESHLDPKAGKYEPTSEAHSNSANIRTSSWCPECIDRKSMCSEGFNDERIFATV